MDAFSLVIDHRMVTGLAASAQKLQDKQAKIPPSAPIQSDISSSVSRLNERHDEMKTRTALDSVSAARNVASLTLGGFAIAGTTFGPLASGTTSVIGGAFNIIKGQFLEQQALRQREALAVTDDDIHAVFERLMVTGTE